MRPYFFAIKIHSVSDKHPIKMALAHVWVFDQDIVSAQEKAVAYLLHHHWIAEETDISLQMHPEQLAQLDKREEQGYLQAQKTGIGCSILGSKT